MNQSTPDQSTNWHEEILSLLRTEGLSFQEIDDEQAIYHIRVNYHGGLVIYVVQLPNREDRIVIGCNISVRGEIREALSLLGDDRREEFHYDLWKQLTQQKVMFRLPDDEETKVLQGAVCERWLLYSQLSQASFLETLESIYRCFRILNRTLQHYLPSIQPPSSTTSRDQPGFYT